MVQSRVQTNPVLSRSSPFSRMRMWALACWRRRGKRLLKLHLELSWSSVPWRKVTVLCAGNWKKKNAIKTTTSLSSRRDMATTGSKPPPQESLPYTLSLGHGSSQKATKAGQLRLAELKEWKKAREEAKKIEAMAPKKPRFLVRHLASKMPAATVPGKSLLLSSSCNFFILLWTLIWLHKANYQHMSG